MEVESISGLRESRLTDFSVSETALVHEASRRVGHSPANPGDPVLERALLDLDVGIIDPASVEEYKSRVLLAAANTRAHMGECSIVPNAVVPAAQAAWWLSALGTLTLMFRLSAGEPSIGLVVVIVVLVGALIGCGFLLQRWAAPILLEHERRHREAVESIAAWSRIPLERFSGQIPADTLLLLDSLRHSVRDLVVEIDSPFAHSPKAYAQTSARSFLVVRRTTGRSYFVGSWK